MAFRRTRMAQRPIACNTADPYHSGDERYPPKGALSRGGSAHEHSLRSGPDRVRRRRGPLHLPHCPRGAGRNLKFGRRAGRVAVALSDGHDSVAASNTNTTVEAPASAKRRTRSSASASTEARPTSRGQQASRALVMNSSKPTSRWPRTQTSPTAGPRSEKLASCSAVMPFVRSHRVTGLTRQPTAAPLPVRRPAAGQRRD